LIETKFCAHFHPRSARDSHILASRELPQQRTKFMIDPFGSIIDPDGIASHVDTNPV